MSEPGTAAYLAGLRLSQARDCRGFLEAAGYWKAPTENLICGDVDGNIAFQASALTPNRRGWSGRLPVPGGGDYEWDGFRTELPRLLNPPKGYIATANNNTHTSGFWPPVMFKTLNNLPFDRITRVEAVINSILATRKWSIEDSQRLQHDAYSLRGALEQELFKGWTGRTTDVERARRLVAGWDGVLAKDSQAAAIYITWRGQVDPKALDYQRPLEERTAFAEPGLAKTVEVLTRSLGPDWSGWRYGRVHQRDFPHPFVRLFDLPVLERSGGNGAVFADGASYREILDVSDWDRSLTINVPGQSGQPESPFYGNLLPLWDRGEYFPMVYSRAGVDREAAHRLTLRPSGRSAPTGASAP
jgi:penicillin amidase